MNHLASSNKLRLPFDYIISRFSASILSSIILKARIAPEAQKAKL